MTGQPATVAGGAGICNVFCCTASIRVRMESPSELINKRDRHDEHGDPEQRQQSRGEPGPSAEMGAMRRCRG